MSALVFSGYVEEDERESEGRKGENLKMRKYGILYVFRALVENSRASFSKPVY